MTDDFFLSMGRTINDIIRGINGVPSTIITKKEEVQQTQQKTPCTNCGQHAQQPQLEYTRTEINNGIQFNDGPARIVRQQNKIQSSVNDNYINNGIRFS